MSLEMKVRKIVKERLDFHEKTTEKIVELLLESQAFNGEPHTRKKLSELLEEIRKF